MRILVTGTAGFIGSKLAELLLNDGHEICGVDAFTTYYDVKLKIDRSARLEARNNFYRRDAWVEDMDAMSAIFDDFKPEVVIHLAAQAGVRYSLENPRAYVDANIIGSFNIIELAKKWEVKHLLMASTSSAYGANTKHPSQETDAVPHPMTIYAATKLASELIGHSHSHLYGTPTTMLRFFTVYGPWGRPDMAFFKFTDRIFKGEPIDVYNHGRMKRDFTYVDDIARAVQKLIDAVPERGKPINERDSLSPVAPHRVVNIGSETPVELMDYIHEIEASIGKPAIMNMMDMQPGDVPSSFSDSRLLHDLTGYQSEVQVKEGIKAFVDWYKEYYNPS